MFSATTRMDKATYAVLGTIIVLGLARDSVSIWFRGNFRLDPQPELIAAAPIGSNCTLWQPLALFARWPFTRLVHAFSAPLGYLTRPYIVYRSRDDTLGSRKPRRGWGRVGS